MLPYMAYMDPMGMGTFHQPLTECHIYRDHAHAMSSRLDSMTFIEFLCFSGSSGELGDNDWIQQSTQLGAMIQPSTTCLTGVQQQNCNDSTIHKLWVSASFWKFLG